MHKILAIIKREYKEAVYKKSFIILTLLMPVLMIGFTIVPGLLMTLKTQNQMTIHVIDESGKIFSPLQNSLATDTLKSGKPRYVLTLIPKGTYQLSDILEKEKKLIASKKLDALLFIPADLDSTLQVRFYARNVADIDMISRLKNEISSILSRERLLAAGIQPALIKKLTQKVRFSTYKITKEGKESKSGFLQEYFTTFILVFFLYFTIILYGAGIMRSIIQEKTSRIVETILSGANSFQFMAGKILGMGAVSFTQYLIWIVFGIALFLIGSSYLPPGSSRFLQINPIIFVYFILFFILGYLLYSALYAAVGAISNSEQEAQNAAYPVTLSLIVPIIMFSYVVKSPNASLSVVLSQIPLFSPVIMFARINLSTPPTWQILLSIGLLVLTIIFVIWIVAKIFRVGILMYGKRPTLPELLKWIKY